MATLNKALKEFWYTPARNRILYGGRASSKSWDAAGVAIARAQYTKTSFLCTRQFQCRITDSVYSLLKIQIERFELQSKFRILDNKIICTTTGSTFIFVGLWRHIDEIKSLEGIDVHWSEEAHLLSKEQWDVIEPTIRKENSEHWIIFNPKLSTDFAWKRFVVNPPPDTIVRKINYDENPFLSSTMLKIIEAAKIENEEDYNHIYLGVPRDDDEGSIIKRSHVMAAIDAHIKLGIDVAGTRRIGFDVADDGEDSCAAIAAYGSLVNGADLWKAKEDELLKSCTRVWTWARELEAEINYDAIGVGAHCGAKFNELNQGKKPINHSKYFAGGSPIKPDAKYKNTNIKNRDFFCNIKSQSWWNVSDRFINTYNAVTNGQSFDQADMIFIDSTLPYLDKLIDELCTPKKDFDPAGRVKVESKKDLSKRDIMSPNLADAFIMACQTTIKSGLLF
jgi:phage terminase large subunit